MIIKKYEYYYNQGNTAQLVQSEHYILKTVPRVHELLLAQLHVSLLVINLCSLSRTDNKFNMNYTLISECRTQPSVYIKEIAKSSYHPVTYVYS